MSVLQDMTKGIAGQAITERKAQKATKLTPVAGETSTTVAQVAARISDEVAFLGHEAVEGVIRDLRKTSETTAKLADELEAGLGKQAAAAEAPKKLTKQEQRLAGADPVAEPTLDELAVKAFAEDFAAQQEAAKAAVFTSLDATGAESQAATPVSDGWQCPAHPDSPTKTLTSRKGRVYEACTVCDQFEKE